MTSPLHVDLVLAETLAPDVEADLTRLFSDAGADVTVRVLPPRRGPEALSWVVLATISLEAFFKVLSENAFGDLSAQLRALVGRLRRHGSSHPPLVLMDPATGLRIVLEPDLPAAAFSQLVRLELSRFQHGPLHYDLARSRWRSELDEAGL